MAVVVEDRVDEPAGRARPRTRPEVRLPRPSDPRLHVASLLLTVQVLGQVSLGFELSIAQILVSLGTAGLIEGVITFRRARVIAWPASALLTGNGIALILRVPGTEHGDWWSLRGWYVFAATAAVAVLSKYVIRVADRPLFNPSNLGLVLTFLVLGAGLADPQDLWWGPMSVGLALTYLVIGVGGIVITRRLHLLAVAASFWFGFAALMALLAATGHEMTARWSIGPVAGVEYWTTLALSPEILVFTFFMITDPRTAARGRTAHLLFGGAVAAASGVLVAFQTTEYATKVALLAGLVAVCALRPAIERWAPAGPDEPRFTVWAGRRPGRGAVVAGVAVLAIAAVGAGSATAALPAVTAPGAGPAPEIRLAEDQRPAVTLGPGADDYGAAMDLEAATAVATDTVTALLVADRASADGDDDLAATVAAGPYLRDLVAREPAPAPDRTVEGAVVDVVKEDEEFQALPMIVVRLTGTADGDPWEAAYVVAPTASGHVIVRPVGR